MGRTCQTGPQEESGNQALQGMEPGTRKLPAAVTWSLPGLQFLPQPVSAYDNSPLLSMFLNSNSRWALCSSYRLPPGYEGSHLPTQELPPLKH